MSEITFAIEHYGLAIVFLSVLLDKAGLPIPSYPVLLVAGALSLSGGAPISLILAAATAGALIADLAWYAAAVKLGRRVFALLCKFTLSPDSCVRRSESVFTRIGPWSLLVVKFIPGLRYVSIAVAGFTRVSLPLFIVLDGVGNLLYFTVAVMLGRMFHDAIDSVLVTLAQLGAYGVALIAGGLVLYLALRWIDRQNFIRQLRMDRISVEELGRMMDEGHKPIVVDVRPVELRMRDGMIPGALIAEISGASGALKDLPRDVELVVYCSCPNEASAAIAALHLKRAGFKRIRPLLGGIEAWVSSGRPIEAPSGSTATLVPTLAVG
jgi:membrane protein DedA with SNARE-associated domain/rhodanese-related sulfurtransferase